MLAPLCSFSWIIAKFYWSSDFVEFVLGRFSHFYIEIAYSNFTFVSMAPKLPVCVHSGEKSQKIRDNEHTPAIVGKQICFSFSE